MGLTPHDNIKRRMEYFMTENLFVKVKLPNGLHVLAERKTNYMLPCADLDAMCILLNYALRNQDVPDVGVMNWWEREEYQEYLDQDVYGEDD